MVPGKRKKSLCPVAKPLLGSKAVRQRGAACLAVIQLKRFVIPHPATPGGRPDFSILLCLLQGDLHTPLFSSLLTYPVI